MPNNIFKKYTLSDAVVFWVQSRKNYWKPGTYTVYMQRLTKYILPFLGNMKLNKITEDTMECFAAYLASLSNTTPLSENYISQICGTVRRILIYMEEKYHCSTFIPSNPVAKGRSRKIILPSTDSLRTLEQYLLIHCEEDTCLGILIAFHTGIRIGELSALTWRDINLEEGLIYIRFFKNCPPSRKTDHAPVAISKSNSLICCQRCQKSVGRTAHHSISF